MASDGGAVFTIRLTAPGDRGRWTVTPAIRVLVVEDDPFLADAHRELVGRVAGFEVIGVAHSGAEALRFLAAREVDLVLLDIYLPDMAGLEVVQALRARGLATDVIAVTSARDLDVVRAAVSQGVVQYLLKPFTFAALRDKLDRYADYRRQVTNTRPHPRRRPAGRGPGAGGAAGTRPPASPGDERGHPRRRDPPPRTPRARLSASQVADDVGVSRVTARRYLEHLASSASPPAPPATAPAGPSTTTPGSATVMYAVAQFHPMGGYVERPGRVSTAPGQNLPSLKSQVCAPDDPAEQGWRLQLGLQSEDA